MSEQRMCTVVEAVKLNPHAFSVTMEVGEMLPEVGQFVHVKCGDAFLLRRPISICDWQEGESSNLLRMVFEVRGEGTAWLAGCAVGDKLDVMGPLGHGFTMEQGGKYLLVGGGIGVPPMLACAGRSGGSAVAVLGFRSADRVMLTEEFEARCREVVVMTDDGSQGRQGYVDAAVREILAKENDFTGVLACGPKIMLRNVAKVAAEFGVPCQVSMEERMGCGVGACLVCACDMADGTRKHVCKCGPVFSAEEVDWNV